MRINEDAIVRVRAEAVVRAEPEEIWRWLADIPGWPRWMPHVGFTSLPSAPEPGTIFHWKVNGMQTVSRIEVMEPGHRIGWSNRGFGTHGGQLVSLAETPEVGVTRVESIEVVNGWVTWLLRRTIRRTLDRSADLWMRSIAERAGAR